MRFPVESVNMIFLSEFLARPFDQSERDCVFEAPNSCATRPTLNDMNVHQCATLRLDKERVVLLVADP